MKENIKKSVLRRLKIASGQIGGLQKMVDKDTYCVDIITQSAAVREALSSVERLMLENHLSTHVIHQMKHGKSAQAVAEILKIHKLSQKKHI
jgi:CsoR family transcriptional regulator, copper-sensing transcriptional repressor